MTQNGKIFLTKNTILNLFAEQQLSLGLSLYIIKDIQQQLQKMYNNIIKQQLKENQKQQQIDLNIEENTQIDMTDSGLTITSVENDNQDQAD